MVQGSGSTKPTGIETILAEGAAKRDLGALLHEVLDAAIALAGADMGTLQLLDRDTGLLKIAASRGLTQPFLKFFEIVTPGSNTACGAAQATRMRIIVEEVSASYLFVGTRVMDVMQAAGVAAVHATPFIAKSGRLWGVFSTYWRRPLRGVQYDPTPLDRLAADIADHLERRLVQ